MMRTYWTNWRVSIPCWCLCRESGCCTPLALNHTWFGAPAKRLLKKWHNIATFVPKTGICTLPNRCRSSQITTQPAMAASPPSRLLHLRLGRLCGQLRALASEPSSLLGEDARSQATWWCLTQAAKLVYTTHITLHDLYIIYISYKIGIIYIYKLYGLGWWIMILAVLNMVR